MTQQLLFWLPLTLKLVLTAGIVVTASIIVERSGPLIGALVVTLPVTVWPAYVFLSLDHDAAYIASSAEAGLAVNAVSAVFMLIYLVLAQKRGLLTSLGIAVTAWVALAWLTRQFTWTLYSAVSLNLLLYPLCLALSKRYREVKAPRIARQWYELPLRTALVCALMATVLLISHFGGAVAAGMIAVYPISTTCSMLILHTRIGGQASAAVIANGLWGLFSIGLGLFALGMTIGRWGTAPALALLLAVPVSCNLLVWYVRSRRVI
jgi:hypothetical protein